MTVALIIARGGSRRLPRKNVKSFCGHPLIAWSIVQARSSNLVDLTVVATDDDEIDAVAQEYGAVVVRHPVWNESANRTFVYSLGKLTEMGYDVEAVITMLPPAPLRLPGDIDRLVTRFHEVGSSPVATMTRIAEITTYLVLTPHICRRILQNKTGEYMTQTCGMAIRSAAYLQSTEAFFAEISVPDYDALIEADKSPGELYYSETQPWQVYETDDAERFELCETLMEHYVLRGKPMNEVYAWE